MLRWLTYLQVTCSCCASFLLLFHFDNTKIKQLFNSANFFTKIEKYLFF